LLQRGPVDPKFQVEGVVPHQPFFFSVNQAKLSFVRYIKIWTDLSFSCVFVPAIILWLLIFVHVCTESFKLLKKLINRSFSRQRQADIKCLFIVFCLLSMLSDRSS